MDGMQKSKKGEEGGEREYRGKREEWRGGMCVTVGAGPERLSVRTDTPAGTRLGGRSRSVLLVSSEL